MLDMELNVVFLHINLHRAFDPQGLPPGAIIASEPARRGIKLLPALLPHSSVGNLQRIHNEAANRKAHRFRGFKLGFLRQGRILKIGFDSLFRRIQGFNNTNWLVIFWHIFFSMIGGGLISPVRRAFPP